jgi:hypothetical protein
LLCGVQFSHDVLQQVADLLDVTQLDFPYQQLKDRLLSAHELNAIQRAEKVMQMADLGGQKPSQFLAAMLEWCPCGEQKSPFFIAAFLRRLPNELRILLAHEDFADLKAVSQKGVSQKADALWQLCPRADPLAVVTDSVGVDTSEMLVARVGQRSAKDRSAAQQQKKKKAAGKKSITYCWRHHQFREKAYNCADPATCMWSEN